MCLPIMIKNWCIHVENDDYCRVSCIEWLSALQSITTLGSKRISLEAYINIPHLEDEILFKSFPVSVLVRILTYGTL